MIMKVFLEFLNCGRVRAINVVNGEWVATGEYTRVLSLLYGRATVVQR